MKILETTCKDWVMCLGYTYIITNPQKNMCFQKKRGGWPWRSCRWVGGELMLADLVQLLLWSRLIIWSFGTELIGRKCTVVLSLWSLRNWKKQIQTERTKCSHVEKIMVNEWFCSPWSSRWVFVKMFWIRFADMPTADVSESDPSIGIARASTNW